MKKFKLLFLALLTVCILAVPLSACSVHNCENKCAVCGKCSDGECEEQGCEEKCEGHAKKYGLKIMSCNLGQDGGSDVNKQKGVVKSILDELPDLFGVQEETPVWKDYLETRLAPEGYARVGEFRSTEPSQPYYGFREASAVYYCVDRFRLKDSGTFWLSETPDVPGSVGTGWSSEVIFPRVCTWVVLTDKKSGEDLAYFNTHFSYETAVAREKSAELILSKIKEKGIKSFFSGDLNFASNTENGTYDILTEELDDARISAPDTMGGNTFHAYGYGPGETYPDGVISTVPIDYIFATKNDFTALTYKILKEKGGKGVWDDYYSDHYFIAATFEYTEAV